MTKILINNMLLIAISISILFNFNARCSDHLKDKKDHRKIVFDQSEVDNAIEYLNEGKDYKFPQDSVSQDIKEPYEVVFPENIKLSWHGEGVLVIDAYLGIKFEKGSLIRSFGKGGLILNPMCKQELSSNIDFTNVSIEFEDQEKPYIDFSESKGAIRLSYNPKNNYDKHKYMNPQSLNNYCKLGNKAHFQAFMYVNNENDLASLNLNLEGCYALNRSPGIQVKTDNIIHQDFKGKLFYNNYGLSYVDGGNYQRTEDVLFKNFTHAWNEISLWGTPPLLEEERKLFKCPAPN